MHWPRYLRSIFLVVAIGCAQSQPVWSWGGRLHMDISRRAAQIVPDEMAGWRAYRALMAENSIRPDLWKEGDPSEGVRHFIDSETYVRIGLTNLPPDRAEALRLLGEHGPQAHGIAPWIILDLQARLTQAMASNDWPTTAALAAAQGHYVADIHQPLHTTKNYDGSSGEGAGVHLRWEVEMPGQFWRVGLLTCQGPEYITNIWPTLLTWVVESHALYPEILEADDAARAEARGNVDSRRYYSALWQRTQPVFVGQANAAALHLASLWYTAWLNAGRPSIPPPPEKISEASIWLTLQPREEPSAWPFFIAFVAAALVIIILCARRERVAHNGSK